MVAIIDLDSVAYVIGWGNKIQIGTNEEGNPIYQRDEKGRLVYQDKTEQELIDSADFVMNDILIKSEATAYVAYIKGNNTGKHRYEANCEYKANRKKEQPCWWAFVKSYLEDNWNAISVDNYEVDDYVATTAKALPDSFIMAIDKDLLQLEGTHYNWKTGEWITVTAEEAELYFYTDMIVGQPTDGLKGIPGKGKAFAKKLFNSDGDGNLHDKVETAYKDAFFDWAHEFDRNYQCLRIVDDLNIEVPAATDYNLLDQLEKGFNDE